MTISSNVYSNLKTDEELEENEMHLFKIPKIQKNFKSIFIV
jgi:hypothetical protein